MNAAGPLAAASLSCAGCDGGKSAGERARSTVRAILASLIARGDDPEAATEFVAGMTDRFALAYAAGLD